MDVSELRKRILRALEEARTEAAAKRGQLDEAAKAYETFLSEVAAPLFLQTQAVLKAEKHMFSVQTPASSVRLQSDAAPHTYIELAMDRGTVPPAVVGRVSAARGRQGQVLDEHPIGRDKSIAELTEEDVSNFLIAAVGRLLVRP